MPVQEAPQVLQPAPGAAKQGRSSSSRRVLAKLADKPLWMLIPCAVALIVIVLLPVAATLYLSFLDLDISTLREWVSAPIIGWANFAAAFESNNILGVSALQSLGVSLGFSLLTTAAVTPIGILAAISAHRNFRGRGVIRAIFLIPYVVPTFVVALLARIMFLNNTGFVPQVLAALGLSSIDTYWLIGPNAFWALTLTDIWATWPFIYLMVLAGLQTVPREHFEAAVLDGAGPIRKLFSIVLPQLRNVLALAVLLSTLNHFGNFTLAFVMFSSPPPDSAAVLPLATYFYAFTSFEYGLASAIAVLTMAVLIVPGYFYIRMTRIANRIE